MSDLETRRDDLPLQFWKITFKTLRVYKKFFPNYFILALLTYLPLFLFNRFSQADFTEFIEFFHGGFLDIIIFLTIPCVFLENKVFSLATISLFLQKFFASAVIISLIQLAALIFFIKLLAGFGFLFIIIGIIPYIFLAFAGFFLIIENSPKLISVKNNLFNSVKLVKRAFFPIFWNYITITILVVAPLFMFSVLYFSYQPELAAFLDTVNPANNNQATGEELIQIVQSIIETSYFQWSRAFIHITFRPIKSIFLSLFFLGLINYAAPEYIKRFLGSKTND